jgi:hypothetical protein
MEQIINKALAFLGKKFDELISATQSQSIVVKMGDATDGLERAAVAINAASDRLRMPDIRAEFKAPDVSSAMNKIIASLDRMQPDTTEQEKTNKLLKQMCDKKVEPPVVTIAPSTSIEKKLDVLSSDIRASLSEVSSALKLVSNIKLAVPSTFKLDEMQARALTSSQKGITTTGGVMAARNVAVINVALDTANTEYTHTFGSNVVSWQLRVRDTDVPVLAAHTAGKLPISGDGTAYFTIPAYYIQANDGLDWSGKKLYLQTGSASQVAEIIEYRA